MSKVVRNPKAVVAMRGKAIQVQVYSSKIIREMKKN